MFGLGWKFFLGSADLGIGKNAVNDLVEIVSEFPPDYEVDLGVVPTISERVKKTFQSRFGENKTL